MTKTEFVTVTITGPTVEGLTDIVRALVEARLAACGNIVTGITSIYRWQGVVEQAPEALALIHTDAALFPQVSSLVSALHPYDVPQVTALPISEISDEYSQWLHENTQ